MAREMTLYVGMMAGKQKAFRCGKKGFLFFPRGENERKTTTSAPDVCQVV